MKTAVSAVLLLLASTATAAPLDPVTTEITGPSDAAEMRAVILHALPLGTTSESVNLWFRDRSLKPQPCLYRKQKGGETTTYSVSVPPRSGPLALPCYAVEIYLIFKNARVAAVNVVESK